MTNGKFWTAIATALLMCRLSPAAAQASTSGIRDVLVQDLTLSSKDLDAVSRGQIVAKALPTRDQLDVSVVAVARADRRVRSSLVAPPANVHLFAQPASLADVQDVRVASDDVDELRQCRPGSCNFKLPTSDMEAVRAAIDSAGAGAPDRVTAYVRQRMVEYVNAYHDQGSAAMVVYGDEGSVESGAAFDEMMRDSSRLVHVAPLLAHYIDAYPHDSLPGATSTFLWSVDAMPHLHPVMRIMQRVVYTAPDDSLTTLVVSKQLYADHYFEAGLEAVLLTDAASGGFEGAGGDALIIETRRYRFDHLPSGGLLNLRGRVVSGIQSAVVDDLKRLRGDK